MDRTEVLILQNAALVLATLAEQFDNAKAKKETANLAMQVGNIALKAQAKLQQARDRATDE